MKNIKALIIDDEPSAINTLSLIIKHYVPEITELKSTTDPHEGLFLLKSYQPNLLLIDIQMPLMTGFDLLKQVPNINFNIIFTTAHDQYAIEAIRFSALDYLLKPIDAEELQAACQRLLHKIDLTEETTKPLYNNFLHNINVSNREDFKLALPTSHGTFFYTTDEIIRLEGESNYSKFFFANGKTLLTAKTLKEYEEILHNYHFIRIHKSHLINRKHITNCSADGVLTMTDGSKTEISRRRKEDVFDLLKYKIG